MPPIESSSALVVDQYEFSQYSSPLFVFPAAGDFDLTGYMKHLVSVNTLYEDDFIHKVYGSADMNAAISVPQGMYNDFIGGASAGSSPCYDPTWMNSNTYTNDSWVGIGLTCAPSFSAGESDVTIEESGTNAWSDNFQIETFSSGNSGPVDISMDDASSAGSWSLPNTSATNGFAGEDCKSVVMQITSEGSISWTLNAEIWVHGDENTKVILTQTYNGESMETPIIEGCTDPNACNYYGLATSDNGSCEFPDTYYNCLEQCLADADEDGVCDELEILGCQDDTACNYNENATESADTCVYATGCETCTGETDGTGGTNANDDDEDGVCNSAEVVGCGDSAACNFNAAATDAGDCVFPDGICETCSGETDGSGTVVDNDADDDGVCDNDEVVGCEVATACNYNAAATDAADCIYASGCDFCSGETDGSGTVIDNDSDNDDICDSDEIVGCQDPLACNFNSSATDGGVSCQYAIGACAECGGNAVDGTGTVLGNDADEDGVCDADEVPGCQNSDACNFNSSATDEDGSCLYALGCESCSGAVDGTGTVLANDDDSDGVCNGDEIPGCQDSLACNYNASATDPGISCVFPVGCESCSGATDGSGIVLDNDADGDQICDADEVVGCTNQLACNYDPSATDDGDCYIAGEYYGCDGNCLNDVDGNGICDEIDDLISNADFLGYAEGVQAGLAQCIGADYCGEGTVWVESLQLCVEDSSCPGDLNGDDVVGTGDLLMLLNDYGFACD